MRYPDWFTLIQQWRIKGMGEYGITLPFLVGALAYKSAETSLGTQHIQSALDAIINSPVDGYVTEVRWCGGIDSPVFTVRSAENQSNQMVFKSFFKRPNSEEPSLGFSSDLQSMFGLGCENPEECYEKLISHAAGHVENGRYSRNYSAVTGKYEYGSFIDKDLAYICETIMGD